MNLRKVVWMRALVMLLALSMGASSAWAAPSTDQLPETKNPTSVKFTMSGSVGTSGGVIPITGSGAVSGNDFTFEIEMSAPTGASGPEKVGIAFLVKGDKIYFKFDGLTPETEGKWFVSDYAGDAGMGGVMGMDMAALEDALTVSMAGKETIHGVSTTKYDIEVDTSKLLPEGTVPEESLPEGTSIESSLTMSMWVGDVDMYIHRLMMVSETTATVGETTSNVRFDLTMNFSDFDMPVTITEPENAEPLDLGLDGGILSGTVLGGIPGTAAGMTTTVGGMPNGMPTSGAGSNGWLLLLVSGIIMSASGLVVRRVASRRKAA